MRNSMSEAEELKELRKELVDVRAELWAADQRGAFATTRNLERREWDLEERIKAMEKESCG